MTGRSIIGIGETVLDIVLKEGKALAAVPGGSVFNSMVSLGRTAGKDFPDVPLVMVTQAGDDQVADLVTAFMEENHLDTRGVIHAACQSNISIAMLDAENNASYEFYRDAKAPLFQALEMTYGPGDILLFGSTFAVGADTREQVRRMLRPAREAGAMVYYDINFRKSRTADKETIRREVEANIALSDIVRGSAEDIEGLYGTDDAEAVYRAHIAPRCPVFICTRGADATEVFSPRARASFPVQRVETVTTIGAGDNFNAGILYGLLRDGIFREKARDLGPEDWPALVQTALRFSAEVCRSLFNYVSPDFQA